MGEFVEVGVEQPRRRWTLSGTIRRKRRPAVDFAELVWIHQRWRDSIESGAHDDDVERRYRDTLAAFQDEHGSIVNAYWCSRETSGAALTMKPPGVLGRLLRRPPRFRFHRLTDWSTKNKADVAALLHQCDSLAIKAAELLRGTTQKISMELIMSSATHVLGLADESSAHDEPNELRAALKEERRCLAATRHYYEEVALREGQIVYFWGMMAGFAVIAAIAGVGAWLVEVPSEHLLYVTLVGGALGAVVSVLMRVTKNNFEVDADLGRASLRRLGSFRPVIGALSGVAVYLAFESGLVSVQPTSSGSGLGPEYFFALIAFLAGFSERFAKDVLDAAENVTQAVGRPRPPDRDDVTARTDRGSTAPQ